MQGPTGRDEVGAGRLQQGQGLFVKQAVELLCHARVQRVRSDFKDWRHRR